MNPTKKIPLEEEEKKKTQNKKRKGLLFQPKILQYNIMKYLRQRSTSNLNVIIDHKC